MHLPTTALLLEPNKVYPQCGNTPCFYCQPSSECVLDAHLLLDSHPFGYHLKIFMMEDI